MTVKPIIDKTTFEALDPLFQAEYEEKEGQYHLKIEGVEDNSGLKKALGAERRLRGDLEKKVKRWEELGKTPEEIDELIAKANLNEEEKLKSAGQWDRLKAQLIDGHAQELKKKDLVIAERDRAVTAMRSTLEHHLIDAQATAAIADQKGTPDLLLPIVQRQIKVIEKDGKYDLQVVDKAGEQRFNAKTGDPLTVIELVTELKGHDKYGRAFEGSGQSGGGSPPGGGGSPPKHAIKSKAEFKTERQRSDFVDTHGLDAYNALPA